MSERTAIVDLLNKFSNDHQNICWKIECLYSDGMGTTMNQIVLLTMPEEKNIGFFTYRVETGLVMACNYKELEISKSENIIDTLLDMINYSEGMKIS